MADARVQAAIRHWESVFLEREIATLSLDGVADWMRARLG